MPQLISESKVSRISSYQSDSISNSLTSEIQELHNALQTIQILNERYQRVQAIHMKRQRRYRWVNRRRRNHHGNWPTI